MSMNQITQGLLGNPLFGMGIGLLSGAEDGGTFAGGAQAGLQNMMLMQGQNQRNAMQDLQMKRLSAQMAEEERIRGVQEAMRAQTPEWLGTQAQPAVPAQTEPYMQSEADLFPGEQPMGGLLTGTPAQPAQPATGLQATNPQMAGLLSDMYQADPMGTQQVVAESMLDQQQRPFGFQDYLSADPEQRALYEEFKGWNQATDEPSNVREWKYYQSLTPTQQAEYRRMKRANQYLDVGTGYVNPDAPPGAPTLDPTAPPPPPAAAGQPPVPAPAVVTKDIIGEKVAMAEGGDTGKRLVSYEDDMAVSEELLLSMEETQGQLAQLFDMTNYETTGVAAALNNIPATDARAWENLKTTLQSRMGLDKMMELKAGSATGSTGFGALNAKELELLVSNLGKLDQASDPADIKRIIISINRQLGDKTSRIRDKMAKQRVWYEENKHQLTGSTADTDVVNWDDL